MALPQIDLQTEPRVRETARRIFSLIGDQKPSVFRQDYWSGRVMEWSLANPAFKTQMFRFVDVLPSLGSSESVARHVQEYLGDQDLELGGALKWGLRTLGGAGALGAKVVSKGIDSQIRSMAGQFILGRDIGAAQGELAKLRRTGFASTLSLLGEVIASEREADGYAQRYLDAIRTLTKAAKDWPALGGDAADWGVAPRVNISVKPSSLYSQFRPQAMEAGVAAAKMRLKAICKEAAAHGASICLDMEHRDLKNLTLAVYRALLEDPELEGWPNSGLAMQAYLRETQADLEGLLEWSNRRNQPFTIRLIKGAYWDTELVHAGQHNWPAPVWLHKSETDAAFEDAARLILETAPQVRLACGSHNVRSIAYVHETARSLETPPKRVEYQVLYGMADPIANALHKLDLPVRMYCPVGELLPGMAYLVRRLLENTSNESFLRRSFVEGQSVEEEVRDPRELIPTKPEGPEPPSADGFRNVPPLDWTQPDVRSRFEDALQKVRARFPVEVLPVMGGKSRGTPGAFDSTNPNRTSERIATVCAASESDADEAVQAARRAFPAWRDTPAAERAAILRRAAAEARNQRHELAALQVFEAGKAWEEADGDVCEAIDFLEYYAHEMRKLGVPQRMGHAPGEDSRLSYEPRGVAAVIAPWNFPLAISTGMASAAIVAGNTVVYKPASETAAIAKGLFDIFERAGLPPGVLNMLPGPGAEVGRALVAHPGVQLIAFTGSRQVGLEIIRRAAEVQAGSRWIKHVIAELGGKNAIILDDDADLDEAVTAVVRSAFGYQGQKCSACSRLILLDSIHDAFLERLRDAVESLPMGPVEDPANVVGAVISQAAREKIERYVELGERELRTVIKRRYTGEDGLFAPLAVFADVPPDHALAQEEIFGPVLSVLRAKDFDHALEIAIDTDYALTGAVFSRSPAHIEEARNAFRVGNLYINRGSTHAIVERHPFGGFKMSGVGSKAGGPDYLKQFLIPRSIVENTTRRGFTPGVG
jgi:RHH-type proline utilization regulon transcriptional repressor/proline dehydrogenase/delta 1-pyrroline-5-carboxylate dehydrogenase